MVREVYIGFEVARLLDEKHCILVDYDGYFDEYGYLVDRPNPCLQDRGHEYYRRYTQALVMRWLREENNIDIIPFHEILDGECYWCRIEKKYGNLLHTELQQEPTYKTYEKACEDAIKYCLENLI